MVTAAKRHMTVQMLKADYSGIFAPIPDYQSCSVTWQRLGVGTGTLTTPERGPAVEALQARDFPVPFVISAPGYPRWSGRAQHVESEVTTGRVGQMSITLVSDRTWLQHLLAAPVPSSPWSSQTAEHDTRTGPLVTVAKAYITANVARLAAENAGQRLGAPPIAVVPVAGADGSPVVTLKARNQTLADLLTESLRAAGYDLTVDMWLPGDPPRAGLQLSTPTLVVDVVRGRDQHYVNFRDTLGGLTKRTVTVTHPQAMSVLVQGPGEKTERVFRKVWAADERPATLGRWGYPEATLDATDVDAADTATLDRRGRDRLAELAGTVSVALELDDRRPWSAGPQADYWVNDTVRATFTGVTSTDVIERLTLSDSGTGVLRASPQFGQAAESPDRQLAAAVAQLRAQLAQMQARR